MKSATCNISQLDCLWLVGAFVLHFRPCGNEGGCTDKGLFASKLRSAQLDNSLCFKATLS